MTTKLEQKKLDSRNEIKKRLKGFDHRTIGTRELLEYAIRNAVLYKYQKNLLLIETVAKLVNNELD